MRCGDYSEARKLSESIFLMRKSLISVERIAGQVNDERQAQSQSARMTCSAAGNAAISYNKTNGQQCFRKTIAILPKMIFDGPDRAKPV
jgi:hypothetical protein